MTQPNPPKDAPAIPESGPLAPTATLVAQAKFPRQSQAVVTSGREATKPSEQLTPEEQMALYEKQLKEEDWGHQPC